MDLFYNHREKIREKFHSGSEVEAKIYALRKFGINGSQICEVIRCVGEEDIKEGHRFGIIVRYNGDSYWVHPDDCKLIQ